MRGRAALAAAQAGGDRAAMRKAALADARRLEKEQMRWATALARLLRAGVAKLDGDDAGADKLLGEAVVDLEALDMHLYAQGARRARGEVAAVDAWMAKQHVRNPLRMGALLVPGF